MVCLLVIMSFAFIAERVVFVASSQFSATTAPNIIDHAALYDSESSYSLIKSRMRILS